MRGFFSYDPLSDLEVPNGVIGVLFFGFWAVGTYAAFASCPQVLGLFTIRLLFVSGVCFIVLLPFVRGNSGLPRPGRSAADALVWAVLSGQGFVPEPFRQRAPSAQTEEHRAAKTAPLKISIPDVEVVRSVEMEFDTVLRKLVPVRNRPAPEPKPVLSDTHLLTQRTYRELKKILRKFEKERREKNRGASGAKIYRTKPGPARSGQFPERPAGGKILRLFLNNWENGVWSPAVHHFFDARASELFLT